MDEKNLDIQCNKQQNAYSQNFKSQDLLTFLKINKYLFLGGVIICIYIALDGLELVM